VQKLNVSKVLTENLTAAMARQGINGKTLAARAGISESHLSEVKRGLASITIELLNDLAYGLRLRPWELLFDTEAARQDAFARLMGGDASPPAESPVVAEPPKRIAARRRKRGG
jgi:transcriptional regulator with XRE-family HTH domain